MISRSIERRNAGFHYPGIAQLAQMSPAGKLVNMALACLLPSGSTPSSNHLSEDSRA